MRNNQIYNLFPKRITSLYSYFDFNSDTGPLLSLPLADLTKLLHITYYSMYCKDQNTL